MKCNSCNEKENKEAFVVSVCFSCNSKINSFSLPINSLCVSCSEKNYLCEQCGISVFESKRAI